jgi:hypothetical protein
MYPSVNGKAPPSNVLTIAFAVDPMQQLTGHLALKKKSENLRITFANR